MIAACRGHLSWDQLSLTYNDPITFVISQWQRNTKRPATTYLIYRVCLACTFLTVLIIGWIIDLKRPDTSAEYMAKWFIYLTHWGYSACTFQAIVSAVMISVSKAVSRSQEKVLKYYKVYWASNIIATDIAYGITTIYWIFLYDKKTTELDAMNMLKHAFNSVLMMIDLFMVSHPVRLLHCCYPAVFGICYAVFNIIYYAAGGLSREGNSYIYAILDWNKPGIAALVCIGVMGILVIIHIITWSLYEARKWLHERLFKPKQDQEPSTTATAAEGPGPAYYDNAALASDQV